MNESIFGPLKIELFTYDAILTVLIVWGIFNA